MANGLKQLGQNSASEFMETIMYMTAYDTAKSAISGYTEGISNPVLKEAVESAANVAVFGGIFMMIRYEEAFMEKVFVIAGGAITALMAFGKKNVSKLANFRGRKLGILSKILKGFTDDNTSKAMIISDMLGNAMTARANQYQSGDLTSSAMKLRDNVTQRDRSSLTLGASMADNYTQSLMFKLLTSSFTANDKGMLKKILGRDVSTEFSVDDVNKIGSFMFTTDDNGKMTGLTDQFFQLLNGLAYVNKV